MRMRKWTMAGAATIAGVLAVAGCASKHGSSGAATSSAGAPVKVAVVYSKTGLLAPYGQEYIDGFKAGLDYATKGTGAAGGHPIQIVYADDTGSPATATTLAKQYIGQGYKIITGTTDSGIAAQLAPLAAQTLIFQPGGLKIVS